MCKSANDTSHSVFHSKTENLYSTAETKKHLKELIKKAEKVLLFSDDLGINIKISKKSALRRLSMFDNDKDFEVVYIYNNYTQRIVSVNFN